MSLARHLETSHQALQDFISLLEDEQKALSTSDMDGSEIENVSIRKIAMLKRLESLEQVRAKGQSMLGYPQGIDGAKKAAKDAQCLHTWDDILKLAYRAKQLNEINGTLIKMRMDQTGKMIDFLMKSTGDSLYGPDGKSKLKGLRGISTSA
jgi:flagellar biosynthesis protein FlgN